MNLNLARFAVKKVNVYYTSIIKGHVMEHGTDKHKQQINRCVLADIPIVITGAKSLKEAYAKWNRREGENNES